MTLAPFVCTIIVTASIVRADGIPQAIRLSPKPHNCPRSTLVVLQTRLDGKTRSVPNICYRPPLLRWPADVPRLKPGR